MKHFTNCYYWIVLAQSTSLVLWCTATRLALRWFANTFPSPLVHTQTLTYFWCPSPAPGWSPAMLFSHPSENDGYIMHSEQRQGQSCRCCAEKASPGQGLKRERETPVGIISLTLNAINQTLWPRCIINFQGPNKAQWPSIHHILLVSESVYSFTANGVSKLLDLLY